MDKRLVVIAIIVLALALMLSPNVVGWALLNHSSGNSLHVYDSSDPLDGVGDGAGGLGVYSFIGDRTGGTNDNQYRGYIYFENLSAECPSGVSEADLQLYHYLVLGTAGVINVSLVNETSDSIASGDYHSTAGDANFSELDVSAATPTNDKWWEVDVAAQINASIDDSYEWVAFRLEPSWYDDDEATDGIYFYSSTTDKIRLNYTCMGGATTTTTVIPTTTTSSTSTTSLTTTSIPTEDVILTLHEQDGMMFGDFQDGGYADNSHAYLYVLNGTDSVLHTYMVNQSGSGNYGNLTFNLTQNVTAVGGIGQAKFRIAQQSIPTTYIGVVCGVYGVTYPVLGKDSGGSRSRSGRSGGRSG